MTAVNPEALELLWSDALRMASARRQIPTATYRLQMHAGFTLRDALKIVPYLHRLGISHLYVSSLLTARPGSLHGYDVVDHSHLNPELGTEEDLAVLVAELRSRHMGLILDVVPNHMWVGEDNEWWMDVLENGPTSRFAGYFDIAWRNHPRERLRGKVLLPILDEPYGKAIQAGRLRSFFEQGRFGIRIDQTRLPLDPRTYAAFIDPALEAFRAQQEVETPAVLELQSILTAVRHLPPRDDTDVNHVSEGLAEGLVIKRRLRELVEQNPEVAAHFDQAVHEIGGTRDQPGGLTRLIELLDAQAYRPCFWRVALDEINYRRFFDVNDLAALAAERIDVFHAIHAKPFEWLRKGILDGLRVDHVDGLLDPKEYLDRLQRHYVLGCAQQLWETNRERYAGDAWQEVEAQLLSHQETQSPLSEQFLYVVIEKLLGPRESIPTTWACNGTTGYEFLNEVNDLFVDPHRVDDLTAVYQHFTRQTDPFEQIAYERKLQVLRSTMASELHVLAHRLDRLAQAEWWSRDFTLNGLRHALEEIIACFPVYRTYVSQEASASDRVIIQRAARHARTKSPLLGNEIFDFIRDTLSLQEPENAPGSVDYREQQRKFAGRFQQLTSPVMAKGVEDTALYLFNRLVSLNEVGGAPAKFGRTAQELHNFLRSRPVDYAAWIKMLDRLEELPAQPGARIELLRRALTSGDAKLFVTSQALRLRRDNLVLFQTGRYIPLETAGPHAQHLFGFLMSGSAAAVLVAVPRLVGTLHTNAVRMSAGPQVTMDADLILPDDWANIGWSNVFTGVEAHCQAGRLPATRLFADFPVALLRSTGSDCFADQSATRSVDRPPAT